MKKYLLATAITALFSISSYAEECTFTNTATIPTIHVDSGNARTAIAWFSNTSDNAVYTSVKIYDDFGNDVTSTVVTGNGSLSLNSKGSGKYEIKGNGATRTIHGEVTWTSLECLTEPMVGHVEMIYISGNRFGSNNTPINSGQPF